MPKRFERHARAKSDWGGEPPRSAEVAAAVAERVVKSGSRKDTRRWCKGKPGREHVPEIVFRPWYGRACHALDPGHWLNFSGSDWHCEHREACSRCGKILREAWKLAREECPDWRQANPRPADD